MGLREIEARLPPGFRFFPSDEELVCHYLYNKVANERLSHETLVEVDLHTCEPWQLPDVAKLGANEWYFFSIKDRKYATGMRANRATVSGYWKATGVDRPVLDPTWQTVVGMRKTLVFYRERAPNGIKTGWVMHEFQLQSSHASAPKENWVLCRVFNKSKGEPSTKFSLEIDHDKIGCSSPNIESSPSPLEPSMPDDYDQITSFSNIYQQRAYSSSPTDLLSSTMLHCNFLEFPLEVGDAPILGISDRDGNDYGFILDTSSKNQNNEEGEPSQYSVKEV